MNDQLSSGFTYFHDRYFKNAIGSQPWLWAGFPLLLARILFKLKLDAGHAVILPDATQRRFSDLMTHSDDISGDEERMSSFNHYFEVLEPSLRELDVSKGQLFEVYSKGTIHK